MANITSVGLTAGLGTSGTGTISTLDNLIGTAGTASSQVLSVQGIASGTAQPVSLSTGGATAVVKAASTAPAATDPALVVAISPNSVNSNGQATMVNSAPVVLASNQSSIPVTLTSTTLTGNSAVNLAQVAGATTAVGSGVQATALRTTLATDSPGIVTLGGATPANSVPTVSAGYTYGNMTTSTTTTFKSGAGVLHTVTINSLGTVASTISIFDNTAGSGTSIAVLNSLTTGQNTYTYDVAFSTGLTLVTTGTVAPNVTVSYR